MKNDDVIRQRVIIVCLLLPGELILAIRIFNTKNMDR
jgi:hypothetical protein